MKIKTDIEIKKELLSNIIPYINNAKLHPQSQIDKIKSSILEFGFNDPIAIDENNILVEGHGRYIAAQQLGMKEIPTIKLSHLNEVQKKQYILAHNKLTLETGFDIEILKLELQAILEFKGDLSLTGFELSEIEEFNIEDMKIESELGKLEDENIPDVESIVKPFTKKGDLWILGKHRLLCGDSTKQEDMTNLLLEKQVDLVITDPPYNVNYEGGTGLKIENDNMSDADFYNFILKAYENMFSAMKKGAPIYIFHADAVIEFRSAFKKVGFKFSQLLVWIKNGFVMGRQDYHWQHEPIIYGWKEGEAHKWYGERDKSSVIEFQEKKLNQMNKEELINLVKDKYLNKFNPTTIREDKSILNGDHPTMKPIKLISRLILNSSRQGDIVLDSFGGSGSTLIACEKTKRINYSIELDMKYADVIVKRYLNLGKDDIKLQRAGKEYSLEEINREFEDSLFSN